MQPARFTMLTAGLRLNESLPLAIHNTMTLGYVQNRLNEWTRCQCFFCSQWFSTTPTWVQERVMLSCLGSEQRLSFKRRV
jgi:hypothetical protein